MKYAFVFAAFLISSAAGAAPAPAPAPVDPNKPVTVTLSVQDWQAVLASVSDSARISARDASRINQTIASQAQAQLAPPSAPAKK
jgi:hypothetical protein